MGKRGINSKACWDINRVQLENLMKIPWRAIAPVAIAAIIALIPPPAGLAPHAWYYFAIFVGVVVGLMSEPLPGAAIGLMGVTIAAVLARFVLFSPAELAKTGFNSTNA